MVMYNLMGLMCSLLHGYVSFDGTNVLPVQGYVSFDGTNVLTVTGLCFI